MNLLLSHVIRAKRHVKNLVEGLVMRRISCLKSDIVSNRAYSCVSVVQTPHYSYSAERAVPIFTINRDIGLWIE